jgi:cytidyltransferase-like protein
MPNRVVLVTGGFDPLHSGHIEHFKAAKELGDILVVGLNSDSWLQRKKGRPFLASHERGCIIENLNMVTHCVLFDDTDGTAIEAIKNVKNMYPDSQIVFAKGGDRTATNTPEVEYFTDGSVEFIFGVGGEDKKNSSSWILSEWKQPKTERPWGYYRVLHDVNGTKVKELTIAPKCSLSMQRHAHRNEYWHVIEGECTVYMQMPSGYTIPPVQLQKHGQIKIPKAEWHKLSNLSDHPCKIVEIQYGDFCEETDIERKS